MNFRTLHLTALFSLLLPSAGFSQDDGTEDRELDRADYRLQEQRAAAIRDRLTLYLDELHKLHTQLTAAGDSSGAAAVQREIDFTKGAIKRLTGVIKAQMEPVEASEKKEDEEEISATTLARRRINGIVARFQKLKLEAPPPAPVASDNAAARQRILKIEKASMKHSEGTGREYWTYAGRHASWTLDDMIPGDYEIILRFSAGEKGGGAATVRVAGRKFEIKVPKGEKSSRKLERNAGTVRINDRGVDIRVEAGELAEGAQYLWDLQAVVLQPAARKP